MLRCFRHLILPSIAIENGNEDFKAHMFPNKCSIIMIKKGNKRNFTNQIEVSKNLMTKLSDVDTSVIIITDELLQDQDVPVLSTPVIILPTFSRLVRYRCANTSTLSAKFVNVTESQFYQSSHSIACPLRKS